MTSEISGSRRLVFGNIHVRPDEIPTVIRQLSRTLANVGGVVPETAPAPAEQTRLTPNQIRKSITRDAIIGFEENKPYKMAPPRFVRPQAR